ncbi:MAG TPA: amidohydrolase family protein [Candidatus Brocadiia bacterium]|nr:amidohydrolase family protein [Candidatus Brocadiia bacterium]
MIADLGCFLGQWPFRSLPASGVDALSAMAAQQGVRRAAVSGFEEVFWEDGFEGARRVAREIAGRSWLVQFLALNPGFPGWEKDLERGVKELGVQGVRLIPGYHGYALGSAGVKELLAAARQMGLAVAMHVRLQDERMHWMRLFAPVAAQEVEAFLGESQGVRVAVMGMEIGAARQVAAALKAREQAWVDWSRMRAMLFGLNDLVEAVGAERIVYASLWPLQTPSSMLNLVKTGGFSPEQREAMLWGNAQAFLGGE